MPRASTTVERAVFDGRPVWVKRYAGSSRVARLRALDWVARGIGVAALRPPPHHAGADARRTERRRLDALAAAGVNVPQVLGEGGDFLVLSDLGQTLPARLRAAPEVGARSLVARAADALAEAHRADAYLGQPVARNLTLDAQGRIGFLDFEEDPRQVMSLHDAQARDWLLFASGMVRHVPGGADGLAESVGRALGRASAPVRARVGDAAERLGFVDTATRWLGRRAQGLGAAVRGLQRALKALPGPLLLGALLADYLHDGEIELIELLIELAY